MAAPGDLQPHRWRRGRNVRSWARRRLMPMFRRVYETEPRTGLILPYRGGTGWSPSTSVRLQYTDFGNLSFWSGNPAYLIWSWIQDNFFPSLLPLPFFFLILEVGGGKDMHFAQIEVLNGHTFSPSFSPSLVRTQFCSLAPQAQWSVPSSHLCTFPWWVNSLE